MSLQRNTQKIRLNIFILISFASIVLGSFYSAILSPTQRAEVLMEQAHSLYEQASDSTDIAEVSSLLQNAEDLTTLAQKFVPNNEILNQEKEFFKSAQHALNNSQDSNQVHFLDASYNLNIK